jgi:hypothetical protein
LCRLTVKFPDISLEKTLLAPLHARDDAYSCLKDHKNHRNCVEIVLLLLEPQNGGLRFHAGSTDIKLMPFYCNIWLC